MNPQPYLTTITPYWDRPEMLRCWLKAIGNASVPEVRHIVFFVGEHPHCTTDANDRLQFLHCPEPPGYSIGHYHNKGANMAKTEWIMKLDVDTLPHKNFFRRLLPVLRNAKQREYFNVGMFYMNQDATRSFLREDQDLLGPIAYTYLTRQLYITSNSKYRYPAASNFVCRTQDYLALGGCDERFRGWGWEDYYQLYKLERHWLGRDPLPGHVTFENVTNRCRDEISRPRAKELWLRENALALIHRYHAPSKSTYYRDPKAIEHNKKLLFNYILRQKTL